MKNEISFDSQMQKADKLSSLLNRQRITGTISVRTVTRQLSPC